MKKTLLALVLLCSVLSFGQSWDAITATNASCVPGACVYVDLSASDSAVVFSVTGTFAATLQFEATIDKTNFGSIAGTTSGGQSGVTSTTGVGSWQFNVAGYKQIRVRASAYTSGTAMVKASVSQAAISASSAAVSTITNAGEGMVTFSAFLPVTSGKVTAIPPTTVNYVTQWIPDTNIVLTSAAVSIMGTAGAGCTWGTNTAFGFIFADENGWEIIPRTLLDNGTVLSNATNSFAYRGASGANFVAGSLSAGHKLILGMQGTGCSTWPTNVQVTIQGRSASGADLVLLGDSEIYGLYQNAMAASYPKKFVGNFGHPGEQTSSMAAVARTTMVKDFKAPTVVILGGVNDIINSTAAGTTQTNLTSLVSTLKAAGMNVIVGTIPPLTGAQAAKDANVVAMNTWIKGTLCATDCAVADFYSVIDTATMKNDDTHPNAAGYTAMLNVLKPLLGAGW